MSSEVELTNAKVLDHDYLYISSSLDSMPAYSRHTRLSILDFQAKSLWTRHDVNWWTVGLEQFFADDESEQNLVALSNEGEVEFISHSNPPLFEKIPGAGVYSDDAKGWGYMRTLRQIGDHLYAVGSAGQVYKRLAANHWVHMDDGILQATDVEDRLLLADIHGLAEDDMYLCGAIPGAYGYEGRLFHWDGQQWSALALPTTERLNAIHIENASTVWLCSANGTLLRGNVQEGFVDLSRIEDNQLFYSLTRFNGLTYLASNMGLYVYDGNKIQEVITGLKPELENAIVVDAVEGVLWSIGSKDLARFDGTTWERIHHPDNPRIGEDESASS
ncbi:hypothetical protein [Chitinibacter sp. GC72]|uniref:hypothetical protein n=1 Tax=Chitinibacter sp. GC72 TaxID=1526917 RepID=UPI0012F8BAE2|nr:hypothetical protein [Chitinibacter sp. GC72]